MDTKLQPSTRFDCSLLEELGKQLLDEVTHRVGLRACQASYQGAVQEAQTAAADVGKAQECSRVCYTKPDGDEHLEKLLQQQSKGAWHTLNDSMAQLVAVELAVKSAH